MIFYSDYFRSLSKYSSWCSSKDEWNFIEVFFSGTPPKAHSGIPPEVPAGIAPTVSPNGSPRNPPEESLTKTLAFSKENLEKFLEVPGGIFGVVA